MPFVRRGAAFRRRGMGDTGLLALENVPAAAVFGTPVYNTTTGAYEGGSSTMDWYCNSFLGQLFSPSTCAIPSTQQQAVTQATELADTSAPPAVQAAAIAAGNQTVAAACAQNPADCIAQNAAASNPLASSLFGPNTVGNFLGMKPDGSTNLFAGWGLWLGVGLGAFALLDLIGKR